MGARGQGASVVYDLRQFGVEGGEVRKLESPRLREMGAELLVSLLPWKAQAHHGLQNVTCGLRIREGPECGAGLA
eukprot:1051210-Pyramimonas_sp.AAC.1